MSETEEKDEVVAAPEFEALLEYLRRSRGFDFTSYKRPSLSRRVDKRMAAAGVQGYVNYVDYLEVHPEEFGLLFDTILINVTAFFRDPSAWEAIRQEILPALIAAKGPHEPIRIWSAGCASGEEAYTVAMCMAEALGVDALRDRVKIYATDVDEAALAHARQGTYEPRHLESVPPELAARYFEAVNGRYVFHKDLRRAVIFGRHDLIQDAPISRIDLLICRNTMMYFNSEAQARILDRFYFALNDNGYLFLGKAETLMSYSRSFAAADLKRRIFTKLPRPGTRERLVGLARGPVGDSIGHLIPHVRLREAAFESLPVAQIVVDFSGMLALANDRARAMFRISQPDLGRPLQDSRLSYRPAELRSCIDRAYADRRPVILKDVEWKASNDEVLYLEVHVLPLLEADGTLLGASVTFLDTTAAKRLRDELQAANTELANAYEELQSTNEELETTNEELQSTVEELETTNEELQSTNEEQETMNEELQSTNEELETVNEELQQRGEELRRVNTYLESLLGSLRSGVLVVDSDLIVHIWNHSAEELWGLRPEEVRGKNLLALDIGLPVDQLRPMIRASLAGETSEPLAVQAINRRGRPIRCRVNSTSMHNNGQICGAIVMMEDELGVIGAPTGSPASATGGDGV